MEEAGQLEDAAKAYREALYHKGSDAKIVFNLANVLYALGQPGQAAERFRQAVELDHHFVEAWNNLDNVLVEHGDEDGAIEAYTQALKINPAYADAHYNLADHLEQTSRFSEARRHWKKYLRLEQFGDWADYARRRLAQQAGFGSSSRLLIATQRIAHEHAAGCAYAPGKLPSRHLLGAIADSSEWHRATGLCNHPKCSAKR